MTTPLAIIGLNNIMAFNSSPPDKMAAISQTIFSDAFLWMKSFVLWLKFHWSLFLRAYFDNNPALGKIMAWRLFGAKPLSEPMLTRFTDEYHKFRRHLLVNWFGDLKSCLFKSSFAISPAKWDDGKSRKLASVMPSSPSFPWFQFSILVTWTAAFVYGIIWTTQIKMSMNLPMVCDKTVVSKVIFWSVYQFASAMINFCIFQWSFQGETKA